VGFAARLADELCDLEEELSSRTYRPGPATRFVARRPKLREIVAARFRDRVVHHLLVREIEPDWERVFIHDSYACRPGKGTHAAVDRLESFVRSATRGGRRRAYYLQADVRSFFMSIDRSILLERLDRRLRKRFGLIAGPDPASPGTRVQVQATLPLRTPRDASPSRDEEYDCIRWLTGVLVLNDALAGSRIAGDPSIFERIPLHKRLEGCAPGCGLPLGNLTSQFFGNVYLDTLDQHVKHTLKVPRYIRYVDDIVMVGEDPERLLSFLHGIEVYLGHVLKLGINAGRTRLRPVADGIDFLGYVVHPHHRLVRRRVVGNLRNTLNTSARRLVRHVTVPGASTDEPTARRPHATADAVGDPAGCDVSHGIAASPTPGMDGRERITRHVLYQHPFGELELVREKIGSYPALSLFCDAHHFP
jgi:hypothetical protein